jgi:hypothetical protein
VDSAVTIRATIVFLSAVGLDALWALYIRRSSQGKALAAASCAAVLLGLGAFNAISYLEDHWMLLPAMSGAFIGTYATLVWERRRSAHDAVEQIIEETREHALPRVDVAELALDPDLEPDPLG